VRSTLNDWCRQQSSGFMSQEAQVAAVQGKSNGRGACHAWFQGCAASVVLVTYSLVSTSSGWGGISGHRGSFRVTRVGKRCREAELFVVTIDTIEAAVS
jgi:hypothetical protein